MTTQNIHVHIHLDDLKPALRRSRRASTASGDQIGKGQFELFQNNYPDPSAWIRSLGFDKAEFWIWISGVKLDANGNPLGDEDRVLLIPGDTVDPAEWEINQTSASPGDLNTWRDSIILDPTLSQQYKFTLLRHDKSGF